MATRKSPSEKAVFLNCGVDAVLAKVFTTKKKDGSYRLYGYAVDSESRVKLDGAKTLTSYPRRGADLAQERRFLAARIGHAHKLLTDVPAPRTSTTRAGGFNPLQRQVLALFGEKGAEGHYPVVSDLFLGYWATSTTERAQSYLIREVLDVLGRKQPVAGEFQNADIEELRNELFRRSNASRNSLKVPEKTKNSVNSQLQAALTLYALLREAFPDAALPKIPFAPSLRVRVPQREQLKSLPLEVCLALEKHFFSAQTIGLIVGIALMYYAGLRTSEAAAVRHGDLVPFGDGLQYTVRGQIKGRDFVPYLKTPDSFRKVYLPAVFAAYLERCVQELLDRGCSMTDIAGMPLVTDGKDLGRFADPKQMSAAFRSILLQCGCEEKLLAEAERGMRANRDVPC